MMAMERAKREAQARRQSGAAAEQAYEGFLADVGVPVVRLVATALKSQGLPFSASTPSGSVRLASDSAREDFLELYLDTAGSPPQVAARVSRRRGSRTITEETPVKPGASPDAISEEDLLTFLMNALEPWLAR
jgi:hypothetical protein